MKQKSSDTYIPDFEKDPEVAPKYVAVKPDRPIYGEFYNHLCNNGYKIFTDGAANVLLVYDDEIDYVLTCLKDRGIDYKFV